MTYMTPFERHQHEKKEQNNATDQKSIRIMPKLQWANEVIATTRDIPRQAKESPLKEWWLEQQSLKAQEGHKFDQR